MNIDDTQHGVDPTDAGRVTSRGTIEDYWVHFEGMEPDPYAAHSPEGHDWPDTVGDYMRTSQSVAKDKDGDTKFHTYGVSGPGK